MPKQLIEFSLENGETILVEVEPPTGGGARPIADGQNQIIKISGTLEQEFKKIIKPFAVASSTIISELQKIEKSADEIELKFGLKLSLESGTFTGVLGKVGGEANYEVTLKWNKNDNQP
jgi:hypothetical protein